MGIDAKGTRTVIVLLCGALLVVLNQMLLSPALPTIMAETQVDATTVQWLTSAYALTEAVMIPLSAWFMGRFRTRPLFISCMVLFAAGTLVCAIAPAFSIILLGRVLQACSTGVLMVLVMSLILLIFPREKRGAAMGLVGLVIGFAPAVGPAIGGFLVDVVGWRALFVVVLACSVLIIIGAAATLQNHDEFPHTRFDAPSVIFSSIGLAGLLYGLSTFASASNLVFTIGFIVIGIIFVALFARRQLKLDEPMLCISILKVRRYRTAVITLVLLEAMLIGNGVVMPLYIQDVLGYSATVSGLVILPGALIGAFVSLASGRAYDRFGVRAIGVIGGVMLFVSGLGMCLYTIGTPLVFVIGVNIVFSIFLQFVMTPINTWGVNSLTNDVVQHATAVTNTMNQVGASLGTAIIMSFSAIGMSMANGAQGIELLNAGYHLSFVSIAVLLGIMMLCIIFFVRDRAGESKVTSTTAPALTIEDPNRNVESIMDTEPFTIPAQASLGDAVRLFVEHDVSGAPVVKEDNTVVGFLSNSDILRMIGHDSKTLMGSTSGYMVMQAYDDDYTRAHLADLLKAPVLEVATQKVVSISPDTSFEAACQTLSDRRIKELPVIENGRLVGIVHRRSLMAAIEKILELESADTA